MVWEEMVPGGDGSGRRWFREVTVPGGDGSARHSSALLVPVRSPRPRHVIYPLNSGMKCSESKHELPESELELPAIE